MASPRQQALKHKANKLRAELFPNVQQNMLWDRTTKSGFATVPRALPMILVLMNRLSPKKPISLAYLALWCRAWDDPLVTLGSKMLEIAMEAGFSGQRAQTSLTSRLKVLEQLGFVQFAPGLSGKFHFALILNPYLVLRDHKKKLTTLDWNTLVARMSDIGANDFDPPKPLPPPVDLTQLFPFPLPPPLSAPISAPTVSKKPPLPPKQPPLPPAPQPTAPTLIARARKRRSFSSRPANP